MAGQNQNGTVDGNGGTAEASPEVVNRFKGQFEKRQGNWLRYTNGDFKVSFDMGINELKAHIVKYDNQIYLSRFDIIRKGINVAHLYPDAFLM